MDLVQYVDQYESNTQQIEMVYHDFHILNVLPMMKVIQQIVDVHELVVNNLH
jgi:uncharacterized membrane protein